MKLGLEIFPSQDGSQQTTKRLFSKNINIWCLIWLNKITTLFCYPRYFLWVQNISILRCLPRWRVVHDVQASRNSGSACSLRWWPVKVFVFIVLYHCDYQYNHYFSLMFVSSSSSSGESVSAFWTLGPTLPRTTTQRRLPESGRGFVFFSCPGQLNRWHCQSVRH